MTSPLFWDKRDLHLGTESPAGWLVAQMLPPISRKKFDLSKALEKSGDEQRLYKLYEVTCDYDYITKSLDMNSFCSMSSMNV